jgi:UDP:flavonoid glycosyltransferase YjiC (YdhE family)
MTRPRILFLINGLGLGNSTRCHAVIQRLLDAGSEIAVVTSGNGLWYFRSVPEINTLYEVESLYYGVRNERISIVRTVAAIGDFAAIIRRNSSTVASVLTSWRPDVVVVDSVYTFRPIKSSRIPLVALNNADVIHTAYRRFSDHPKSIRAQFWCVEEADYLFHRIVPDLVISPNLDPSLAEVGGNVRRVGPIIRRGFSPVVARAPVKCAVVMLSGSRFGSPVAFKRRDWPFEIEVVGRQPPKNWEGGGKIRYHGKLLDNKALVESADLVVVNGGFSAISESFSMRKPLVVIPVPNHAEQWINGRTIEHLGVGMSVQESEMEDALEGAARQVERFHEGYKKIGEIPDGAMQSEKLIMSLVGARAGEAA